MDNKELLQSLRKLVHVDLDQYKNGPINKILQPYRLGYHEAYREIYNNLLKIVKIIDSEKILIRKIDDAVSYLNNLPNCKVYKQNLHTREPWLTQEENSNLAVFHSNEKIMKIAKSKGWIEPDLLPEDFVY